MKLYIYVISLFMFSAGQMALGQEAQMTFQTKAALALEAAKAGYLLPNLKTGVELSDYLAAFSNFAKATPNGYEIYGADADLQSGLKFVIYRPARRDGEEPWILSLTGTEGLIDWVNNSDLGRPQFLGVKKIVTLFTMSFVPDKELIITGHSLGGALAQAAAHEIQKVRLEKGQPLKQITLITWNGFGARELINKIGTYRPQLASQMEIANYFVRGDMVSKIGHHFGPTYELIPGERTVKSKLATILELHSLALIEESLSATPITMVKPVSPPHSGPLNTLSKVSGLIALFNGEIHEFRQLWLTRWLCSILENVKTSEQLKAQTDAFTYLYNVGFTEQIRLRAEKHPDKAKDFVRLKNALESFLRLKSAL